MKFRPLLSLSVAFVLSSVFAGGMALSSRNDIQKQEKVSKTPVKTDSVPELNMRMDTVLITQHNINKVAAGVFTPHRNQVVVYYLKLSDDMSKYKKWCDEQNAARRIIARHELEHARKAAIVQNVGHLSGYRRAQVAIMNECMAPAAEIIEAMVYRMETGHRFPVDRAFLFRADSLIMHAHAQNNFVPNVVPINFSNSQIADIILDVAIDKFILDYNRNIYHHKVRRELDCVKKAKYIPHNKCDNFNFFNFNPELNQWGALWTFDIASYKDYLDNSGVVSSVPYNFAGISQRVDIWNSASIAARQRALAKVDACIQQEMGNGRMLRLSTYQKNR